MCKIYIHIQIQFSDFKQMFQKYGDVHKKYYFCIWVPGQILSNTSFYVKATMNYARRQKLMRNFWLGKGGWGSENPRAFLSPALPLPSLFLRQNSIHHSHIYDFSLISVLNHCGIDPQKASPGTYYPRTQEPPPLYCKILNVWLILCCHLDILDGRC